MAVKHQTWRLHQGVVNMWLSLLPHNVLHQLLRATLFRLSGILPGVATIQLNSGGMPMSATFNYPAKREVQRRYGYNLPKLLVLGLASTFGTPLPGRGVNFHKILQVSGWTHHWPISGINTYPLVNFKLTQLCEITMFNEKVRYFYVHFQWLVMA